MKKKIKKKAFTLVELLVVITVLAILASVTVVSYTHFIEKAYRSNDIERVANMNSILATEQLSLDSSNASSPIDFIELCISAKTGHPSRQL